MFGLGDGGAGRPGFAAALFVAAALRGATNRCARIPAAPKNCNGRLFDVLGLRGPPPGLRDRQKTNRPTETPSRREKNHDGRFFPIFGFWGPSVGPGTVKRRSRTKNRTGGSRRRIWGLHGEEIAQEPRGASHRLSWRPPGGLLRSHLAFQEPPPNSGSAFFGRFKRAARRPKRPSRGFLRGFQAAENDEFLQVFVRFQGSCVFGLQTAQDGARRLPGRS